MREETSLSRDYDSPVGGDINDHVPLTVDGTKILDVRGIVSFTDD